jgi:hypothetical protein
VEKYVSTSEPEMSMISDVLGMSAVGMVGLAASGGQLAWNGDPNWNNNGSVNDLVYRQTWTGDSIHIDPNVNGTPWIQPNQRRYYTPDPRSPEDIERERQESMEMLRRFAEMAQGAAARPPVQPTVEPDGVNTEDSFRPQRKLDID